MKTLMNLILSGAMAISLFSGSANAASVVNKKLGQFGIEPRLTCGKWAYPWPGAKICIGPGATEWLQHEFHLVVDGPQPEEAVRRLLEEAVAAAASAAIGAGLITPSPEPGGRVAAALAAAKVAFIGYLAARGSERLIGQYEMRIDHRTFWS